MGEAHLLPFSLKGNFAEYLVIIIAFGIHWVVICIYFSEL